MVSHQYILDREKQLKVCSYIVQYPVCWTIQSGLHFTPLADLFIPTPTQLLWEAFSHTAITARRLFIHIFHYCLTHIFPPLSIASQVLIYTAAWTGASWRERKCRSFKITANGIRTRAPSFESGVLVLSCVQDTLSGGGWDSR